MDLSKTTLALDCSVQNVTLVIFKDQKILSAYNDVPEESQSKTLMSIIDDQLSAAGLKLSDIEQVLFCHGPGSFTSLRVGLATLLGLFWDKKITYAETSSLVFRCYSLLDCGAKTIAAAVSLGRKRFAVGVLRLDHQDEFEQKLYSEEELRKFVSDQPQSFCLSGRGLKEFTPTDKIMPEDRPNPQAFLQLIQKKIYNIKDISLAQVNYMLDPDLG